MPQCKQCYKKGLFLKVNKVGLCDDCREELLKLAKNLRIKTELLDRDINVNFSGGEKKKIQLLELMALQPKYAILDEIDSGMDANKAKAMQNNF